MIIVTMPNCGLCFRLKTVLKSKNIPFVEYSVQAPEGASIVKQANTRDFPILQDDTGNFFAGRDAINHVKVYPNA